MRGSDDSHAIIKLNSMTKIDYTGICEANPSSHVLENNGIERQQNRL
jgi:hypothetical protein